MADPSDLTSLSEKETLLVLLGTYKEKIQALEETNNPLLISGLYPATFALAKSVPEEKEVTNTVLLNPATPENVLLDIFEHYYQGIQQRSTNLLAHTTLRNIFFHPRLKAKKFNELFGRIQEEFLASFSQPTLSLQKEAAYTVLLLMSASSKLASRNLRVVKEIFKNQPDTLKQLLANRKQRKAAYLQWKRILRGQN